MIGKIIMVTSLTLLTLASIAASVKERKAIALAVWFTILLLIELLNLE